MSRVGKLGVAAVCCTGGLSLLMFGVRQLMDVQEARRPVVAVPVALRIEWPDDLSSSSSETEP